MGVVMGGGGFSFFFLFFFDGVWEWGVLWLKVFIVGDSIKIGIKLWPAPQISEHWPTIILGRLITIIIWLIRPGVASDFIPKDGIAQECNTSFEVINIRVGVEVGTIRLLDTVSVRIFIDWDKEDVIFISIKLEYSYAQYHWNPIVLIDKIVLMFSSIM